MEIMIKGNDVTQICLTCHDISILNDETLTQFNHLPRYLYFVHRNQPVY